MVSTVPDVMMRPHGREFLQCIDFISRTPRVTISKYERGIFYLLSNVYNS